MLVRSSELSSTMSRYLIQRIEANPAIELHFKTEIVGLEGGPHLDGITWQDKTRGETSTREIRHLFIMAGASPRTDWLRGCVALDEKGFILTGRDLGTGTGAPAMGWTLARSPYMLERAGRASLPSATFVQAV